jgi:hypothetical protein
MNGVVFDSLAEALDVTTLHGDGDVHSVHARGEAQAAFR